MDFSFIAFAFSRSYYQQLKWPVKRIGAEYLEFYFYLLIDSLQNPEHFREHQVVYR